MTTLADLGVRIGTLPRGATNSVIDVPGAGLGHATVVYDEPNPPEGRGLARTGVTVVDLGGDPFLEPVPAGVALLNGAGELTSRSQMDEWGLAETPVFLTSTMQVGRVYDSACRLLIDRIKERVPIWKREHGPDGTAWVGWVDARCSPDGHEHHADHADHGPHRHG